MSADVARRAAHRATGVATDPRLPTALSLAFVGFAIASGCAPDAGTARTAGGSADTIVAILGARIGEIAGSPEYLFGDVTSVAADRQERVYVADRIGSLIRVYDSAGVHLRTIGREGDGPGEYEWPTDLTFDRDGRLYIRDFNRITVLAGEAGGIPDSVARTMRIPGYANSSSTRGRSDGTLYYYPAYLFRPGEAERYFYLVFDTLGLTGDTVAVPPLATLRGTRSAFYRIGRGSGRMVAGLNRAPFEPGAAWDLTSRGTVVSSDGLSDHVIELSGAGDTIGALPLPGGRRAVPPDERADSAAALQARVDSLPVPLDDVGGLSPLIREGTLPDSLPSTTSLHVALDDKAWVGRWPLADRPLHKVYDVLGPGGYERTVVVPAPLLDDPPPYVSDGLVVGVVVDPATEVQSVLVFRVRK